MRPRDSTTYRVDVEYQGTRYHGWQEQQNARTVAGELRAALQAAGVEVVELGGAGRTDAGVHALAQTAHLRARRPIDPAQVLEALEARLPADIHVLAIRRALSSFHARHDAVSRSYLYQISRRRSGLHKRFVWWVKRPLDEQRIAAGCERLRGQHDFRLFCERPQDQESTLVRVEQVAVVASGDLLLVRFVASHFLWKMVRRLVGVLVEVGAGRLQPDDLAALLRAEPHAAGRFAPAQWTAPPSGLFLERVSYPGEAALAAPVPVVRVDRSLRAGTVFLGAPARERAGRRRQSRDA